MCVYWNYFTRKIHLTGIKEVGKILFKFDEILKVVSDTFNEKLSLNIKHNFKIF